MSRKAYDEKAIEKIREERRNGATYVELAEK